jgi:hypothetical protein
MTHKEVMRLLNKPADLEWGNDPPGERVLKDWLANYLKNMVYEKRAFGNSGWQYWLAEVLEIPINEDEDNYGPSFDDHLLAAKFQELVDALFDNN